MIKPKSLRDHLERCIPHLQRDPEKLHVFVADGEGLSTATKAVSWMYEYKLRLIFLDWSTHVDAIMAPLLIWVRSHQSDLLDNPSKRGIRFDVDYLNADAMDVVIELNLTERVVARARDGEEGALNLHHLTDVPALHMPKPEVWHLYIKDEMVAKWDYPLPPIASSEPVGGGYVGG